jgi:hypothetical protein
MSKALVLSLVAGMLVSCSPFEKASSSALPTPQFRAVLTIAGRGNSAVRIEIGTFVAARIDCDTGAEMAPD